jgi:hypothetical protein
MFMGAHYIIDMVLSILYTLSDLIFPIPYELDTTVMSNLQMQLGIREDKKCIWVYTAGK